MSNQYLNRGKCKGCGNSGSTTKPKPKVGSSKPSKPARPKGW